MKNRQGMTLVEVVIAILLVTFIAIYCGNLIRQNYNLKKFIETSGDHYTLGPAIISLIKKDYIQAYSPHILPKQFFRQSITFDNPNYDANAAGTTPPPADPNNPNPAPAADPNSTKNEAKITVNLKGTELPIFHLVGTADSINFYSLSHRRFYKNQKESSLHEVYHGLQNGEDGLKKIIKRTNVNVEDKLTLKEGLGQEIVPEEIYNRVTELKFEYCMVEKSCDSKWDSEKVDTDKKYPDFIKVTLKIKPIEREIVSYGVISSFLDLNYLPKNFQEKENKKNELAGENELPGTGGGENQNQGEDQTAGEGD